MTLTAKCPACEGPLEVVVGRKFTSRLKACGCGARWDYSCWLVSDRNGCAVHQVDLLPAKVARQDRTNVTAMNGGTR